ncbi:MULTISPECIES: CPXCG motif-containing cysteine-rich protein [Vibrio]|uniref:CPXCG motif-containing cysteine-rich protein n=1 Tax=Vibrio casei TaxID=673372 RepID=A0A368LN93_9VIBR|nr:MULTISPECIES: CPXCG motif-containing cysteine-rich protein [Vibrio]RCS73266.1 CPXCG motif-containing cysteine-rich protein [Vibrio casei]HBV75732.1 CPXCG motif-containing cysteine-rich protein [Vibrio sp.]
MIKYTEKRAPCPHCGHQIGMTVDSSIGNQDFYDDCPACRHAIHLELKIDDSHVKLTIGAEDHSIF